MRRKRPSKPKTLLEMWDRKLHPPKRGRPRNQPTPTERIMCERGPWIPAGPTSGELERMMWSHMRKDIYWQIRHASDSSKYIHIHMPTSHVAHYSTIAPVRDVLLLFLDALVDPRAWSQHIIKSNGWDAYTALHKLTRHATPYTPTDMATMTSEAELWVAGRDQRTGITEKHFYDNSGSPRFRDDGRPQAHHLHRNFVRAAASRPHSSKWRALPRAYQHIHPRALGQREHLLYANFRESANREDLRMWEFKTHMAYRPYAQALWIMREISADDQTDEQRDFVRKHIADVERERRHIYARIAAEQKALADAPNRNVPMRKRVLRVPDGFTRATTSLPHGPLNELRERAFRTTFDPLSRFCTYVWMWAHAPGNKVPHVVAAKLHAFAAGEEWLETLERYRRTPRFLESPLALVNPLDIDAFGSTPGTREPGSGTWRESPPEPMDTRRSNLHASKYQGIDVYLKAHM